MQKLVFIYKESIVSGVPSRGSRADSHDRNIPASIVYYFVKKFITFHLPSNAAWCMSFFGIHPTLTHVPPRPV